MQQTTIDKPVFDKPRLEFLDFIRFVAAFSVLLQHILEHLYPWFRYFSTYYFQTGVFGVSLFFLCSGFIIPVSLQKQNSIKKFWINRFFRLFPLYYLSIFVTLVLIGFHLFPGTMPSIKNVLFNLTMLQRFLNQPSILYLYWTLSLEMLFYFIVSALFMLNILKNSFANAIIAIIVTLVIGGIGTAYLHLFKHGWGTVVNIATMFVGTVFYSHSQKLLSNKKLLSVITFAVITIFTITFLNLYNQDDIKALGTQSFIPVLMSWLAAYGVFIGVYLLRNMKFNKIFLFLGMISYSIYLVQAIVLGAAPEIKSSSVLTAFFWITLIILISTLSYFYIEMVFIKVGKKVLRNVK